MITVVGIFHSESEQAVLEACQFEKLPFIRSLGESVRIDVPLLTVREVRALEAQLPLNDMSELELGSIPRKEAERFAKLYRHLPSYAVLEN